MGLAHVPAGVYNRARRDRAGPYGIDRHLSGRYRGGRLGGIRSEQGRSHQVTSTRYERDPIARAECILKHGNECVVCGFSFGETYGALVAHLIVVHHLVPVASRGGEYVVDPVEGSPPGLRELPSGYSPAETTVFDRRSRGHDRDRERRRGTRHRELWNARRRRRWLTLWVLGLGRRRCDRGRRVHPPARARVTMSERAPVLVVGASGRVGRAVVTELLRLGRPVRALVRRPPPTPFPPASRSSSGISRTPIR